MKKFTVIFSPSSLDDAEVAVAYYEEIQPGLGKRFATQLQVTLNSIKRNPFFSAVRYDNIRCATIKNFPFLIHYYIDEKNEVVSIIAIYSTYKDPLW